MPAQNAINALIGSASAGALAISHTMDQSKIAKTAEIEAAAQKEEQKKQASYGQTLNEILGQALEENPKLMEKKYFDKALTMMEGKRAMMMAQREATRTYRNQYAPSSKEYQAIETAGQERKTQNFNEFRQSLLKLGTRSKKRGK